MRDQVGLGAVLCWHHAPRGLVRVHLVVKVGIRGGKGLVGQRGCVSKIYELVCPDLCVGVPVA